MILNLINDEAALSLQHFYQSVLTETTHPLNRYEAFFTLALLAWRAGDVKTMHDFFSDAAQEALNIIEQRDPLNTNAERIPVSVALPFLLILSFGSKQQITRLSNIKRSQWFQPETEQYLPLANLLDILRNYWTNKTLNQEQLNNLISLNNFPEADVFYKPWIANLSEGLLAVANKDSKTSADYLHKILEQHKNMALEGEWKNIAEGLLSFWALPLATIAKNEGVLLSVNSPYLPQ